MFVLGRYPYFWIVSLSDKAWRDPVNRTTAFPGTDWKTFLGCRTQAEIEVDEALKRKERDEAKPPRRVSGGDKGNPKPGRKSRGDVKAEGGSAHGRRSRSRKKA